MTEARGRACPASYRYGARAPAECAAFEVETLWVAGGLYGNSFALARVLAHGPAYDLPLAQRAA